MGAEIAHVLLHLLWASGTVQPEHINWERLQNRHHGGDIGTHQHGAGGFHGDAHHQRTTLTSGCKCLLNALQGCLDLQNVLTGFNDEQVNVASDQPLSLFGKGLAHLIKADVAKGWQLGGGSHRTRYKAGFLWRGVGIGHLASQFCGPLVDRKGLLLQVVLGEHGGCGPERIGFDHIATGFEKQSMDRLHRIRTGEHEVLVAPLKGGSAEILCRQIHLLQGGACGAVEHQNRLLRAMQAFQKADALRHHHQPFRRTRVTQ